jgi:hypothetical protein
VVGKGWEAFEFLFEWVLFLASIHEINLDHRAGVCLVSKQRLSPRGIKGMIQTPTEGNVKSRPPFREREGWATRKFKFRFKTKTRSRTNQPQDELPEWYHRLPQEVKCEKYGREKVGHPPLRLIVRTCFLRSPPPACEFSNAEATVINLQRR